MLPPDTNDGPIPLRGKSRERGAIDAASRYCAILLQNEPLVLMNLAISSQDELIRPDDTALSSPPWQGGFCQRFIDFDPELLPGGSFWFGQLDGDGGINAQIVVYGCLHRGPAPRVQGTERAFA